MLSTLLDLLWKLADTLLRYHGSHPSPRSVAIKRRILLGCIYFGSLAGFETAEQD